jgi:hypothetical protein
MDNLNSAGTVEAVQANAYTAADTRQAAQGPGLPAT